MFDGHAMLLAALQMLISENSNRYVIELYRITWKSRRYSIKWLHCYKFPIIRKYFIDFGKERWDGGGSGPCRRSSAALHIIHFLCRCSTKILIIFKLCITNCSQTTLWKGNRFIVPARFCVSVKECPLRSHQIVPGAALLFKGREDPW